MMPKNKTALMRQPTQLFTTELALPCVIDLEKIDTWFAQILEIEEEPITYTTDIYLLVSKSLLLIKTLLQASRIPAFYTGYIVSITPHKQDKSKTTLKIALPHIDIIPPQCYIQTINSAFEAMSWMNQTIPTEENIQLLYRNILDKSIQNCREIVPGGVSTIPVLHAAYLNRIPFMHLGDGVYQLGWGSKSRKIDRSVIDKDSAIGSKLAYNKVHSANLIRMAGLPGPRHSVTTKREDAVALAHQIGYPVVVKPSDLNRSEGVTVDITNDIELLSAFDEAYRLSIAKQVIIEKQVAGVCHRLFIAAERLLYCIQRNPKSVQGDGVRNIATLIHDANLLEVRKPLWLKSTPYPNDALALKSIASLGYDMDSIPKLNEWVPLRPIETTLWGIRDKDVTAFVHPENLDIAIRAAALFELDVVGVDIITADITKPWYENGAIINEVNIGPMLGAVETSRSYLNDFLSRFIQEESRIFIELFVGGDVAVKAAKTKQSKLIGNGLRCFYTTHKQTLNHREHETVFPFTSLIRRIKALIINKEVDALVIVVQTDEILHGIFPLDMIDQLTIHTQTLAFYKDNTQNISKEHFEALCSFLKSLIR